MGSYNSQYENYYSSLVNKKKNYGGYGYGRSRNNNFTLDGNFFARRLITDLVGVFILFIFVIGCKMIVTPQTAAAYKYSKEVLNKNYDYNAILSSVKKFDITGIEDKLIDWIENTKSKLTGDTTFKDKIKTSFMLPIDGTIISPFGYRKDPVSKEIEFHEGLDIAAAENTDVVCPFEGKVKDFGEDIELGNYIVIDHGGGIETKYAHLNEILVAQNAVVKKGDVIGKSGNGETGVPHLHFELLYMAENKNPEDYLSINNK
jgi:murein DD-endopeptidase MepM/ murein hydrolase activator NlpD